MNQGLLSCQACSVHMGRKATTQYLWAAGVAGEAVGSKVGGMVVWEGSV